ncbi:SDR family oxidoreductase [Mycobacterium sp. SMC-4]|uniref:SDR family oxidoreductase n=1 Tax=Mycobacterium sp. SMC-4 TaxID=2857059 RepID=UPI0021B2A5F0|nr:SDR family oxidoreductase [Mycobacterium sp. SMC-4]UXA19192.1 SDR family oxidoreductase [Mycobacterium sp. SMC-4]
MRTSPQRIVLVTGADGRLGADVARQLADPDVHVVLNHRGAADRAESIAGSIREAGGHASSIDTDVADDFAVTAMIETVRARFGRLDTLILHPAGGLHTLSDTRARAHGQAQRRLATLAMPLMPSGARIVFVTSHQAHFYPYKAVPKGFAGIAASQRAGETALYAMRSDLAHAGISVTVVSAEITGAADVAAAVVNAATTAHPSGIVYVGSAA